MLSKLTLVGLLDDNEFGLAIECFNLTQSSHQVLNCESFVAMYIEYPALVINCIADEN